jgi:hypothetical protein
VRVCQFRHIRNKALNNIAA